MILVDTNVLARSIQHGHIHQIPAIDAMKFLSLQRKEEIVIVPQVVVEFYAACTRPSNGVNLSPEQTMAEIASIKANCLLLPETPEVLSQWEMLALKYKPRNRQVFDMRLVAAMLVHGISHILSFNDKDFAHFTEIQVLNPFDVLNIPRV